MPKKITTFLMILCTYHAFSGSDITVFTDGSFKGLADPNGNVIIPAVYDGLGWSDGSVSFKGDLIGYLENGKWGLISTNNKKVTSPVYHNLEPFGEQAFLASIQAGSSNHLYHGIIGEKGNTLLSFDYFSIETLTNKRLKVSKYEEGNILYGVRDWEDEQIIPTQFQSIRILNDLFVCESKIKLVKIFDANGKAVFPGWIDNVVTHPSGYLIEQEGKQGLISPTLQLTHQPEYKWIDNNGKLTPMKEWEVRSFNNEAQRKLKCDSLSILNDNLWIAHINNVQHILGASDKLFANQQYVLKYIQNGFIVTQNKKSGKWGLFKTDGSPVDGDFDSLRVDPDYFFCKKPNGWIIYNKFNRKISEKNFDAIGNSVARNIPVFKNGYWGWLDFQGEQLIPFKYDSIGKGIQKQFLGKYVNGWGVSDFQDQWVILPEYDQITVFGKYYFAVKGQSTSVLDGGGHLIFKTGLTVTTDEMIRLSDENGIGLITSEGFIVYPEYRRVSLIDQFYLLEHDTTVEMIDTYGRKIVKDEDNIQQVYGFSEGYFHILKDGKHGFVDNYGRLRIANRYEDAQPFSEGLAPIKLRGKWGYINKNENLVIQPFYTKCSQFQSGLATVSMEDYYGIIDSSGEKIIDFNYNNISRTQQGNYLLTSEPGRVGLASQTGKILLNTNYMEIEDTAYQMVIARKGDKYGVVTYTGHNHLPFEYNQIVIQGDYMLLNQ